MPNRGAGSAPAHFHAVGARLFAASVGRSDRPGPCFRTGCRTSRLDAGPAIRKDGRSMTFADSADVVLPVGFVVGGRYRLDACLGSGAMGTVYAARAVSDGRPFALKIIRREHTEDPTMVARFQREGRLIAKIRHPNVVQVFEL